MPSPAAAADPASASSCSRQGGFTARARWLSLPAMKIVTYNLNGIRARLPRLVEYLSEQKPDLICLQEIKCADESFPIEDIRAAGYDGVWHGQKGFNGVSILAPVGRPVSLRMTGLPGDPDDSHSRYIEAELDGVVLGALYLPNGNPVGTEK